VLRETWENFDLSLYIEAVGLRKIPSSPVYICSGTWKNFDLFFFIEAVGF